MDTNIANLADVKENVLVRICTAKGVNETMFCSYRSTLTLWLGQMPFWMILLSDGVASLNFNSI